VSLILEALKKLDREKQAPDRGVVVVGPAAWASSGDSRFPVRGGVLVAGALVLGGAAGAVWNARRPEPPTASSRSAAPVQPATAQSATTPPMAPAPTAIGAVPSTGRTAAGAPAGTTPNWSRTARGTSSAPGVATTDVPASAAPAEPGDEASRETETAATSTAETPAEIPARKPARSGPAPDFELQAISAQNGQPVAVLNDRLVREGDSFDGVRVLRIGADEVEIEVAGRRRIVKF
jgi:hypothetical protein